MILILAIFIGIAIGRLLGGRIRGLSDLGLRHAWTPVALFVVQAAVLKTPLREFGFALLLTPVVVIATYVALVGWLLLNRTAPGIRLVLVGAILNLTVIAANGGYMPVTPEALERAGHVDRVLIHEEHTFVAGSKDIVLETKETNLWPLSDILVIPDGLPFAATFSGGDILIAVGVGLLAYGAVRRGADERFEVRTGTTSESGRWTTGKDEADA
jgi:hypothetical protein